MVRLGAVELETTESTTACLGVSGFSDFRALGPSFVFRVYRV